MRMWSQRANNIPHIPLAVSVWPAPARPAVLLYTPAVPASEERGQIKVVRVHEPGGSEAHRQLEGRLSTGKLLLIP